MGSPSGGHLEVTLGSNSVVTMGTRRGHLEGHLFLLAPTGALIVTLCYYISIRPLFQIFTHSIDAIDVTSVTLSRLNSINAIDVTR